MQTTIPKHVLSCTPNNEVVVIDLNTRKEINRITLSRPDAITSVIVALPKFRAKI